MKRIFAILFFAITIASLWMGSCIKDKCSGVVCRNMGVCVDGICSCRTGYEGKLCETTWSEKFAGNWNATEVYFHDTSYHHFSLTISKTGNADSIVMYNFADSLHVLCRQDKSNSFVLLTNQVMDSNFTIISGHGTLDSAGTKVTGLYSFKLKDTTITTNFSWTR